MLMVMSVASVQLTACRIAILPAKYAIMKSKIMVGGNSFSERADCADASSPPQIPDEFQQTLKEGQLCDRTRHCHNRARVLLNCRHR